MSEISVNKAYYTFLSYIREGLSNKVNESDKDKLGVD